MAGDARGLAAAGQRDIVEDLLAEFGGRDLRGRGAGVRAGVIAPGTTATGEQQKPDADQRT